jgi:hypothetical protein
MVEPNLPVPAIQGHFGDKLYSYQTQLKPWYIKEILRHDPRSQNWKNLSTELREIYQNLQRKTTKKRREGTARYIKERFGPDNFAIGAFPAISIGFTKSLKFIPYDNPNIEKDIGKLQVDLDEQNTRILLDGLARYTGAMEVEEEEGREIANSFTFPVTIYVPKEGFSLSVRELGQLFHDFNFLISPIAKNQALALDQGNIYIALCRQLAQTEVIRENGGVKERAASLGSNSTALVAQQVFLKFVRGACEGASFQKTLRDEYPSGEPNLTRETFSYIKNRLVTFLEILEDCMEESFSDKSSIHLTAPGWASLGLIFHDVEFRSSPPLSENDKTRIYQRLGQIDWSRYNTDWFDFLGDPGYDKRGKQYLSKARGGGNAVKYLTNYLRKKLELHEFIEE